MTAAPDPPAGRHRSAAVPLAWIYAALIVYASLYPFTGWRVPGVAPLEFLLARWWPWWTGFDLVSNLLGYLPLGALVFAARVRSGAVPWRAALQAAVAGGALSFCMEVAQNFQPTRVPANVDLALNVLGTLVGVAIGVLVHRLGGIERWQSARDRWLINQSAGGVALVLLWPVGLLFPNSVPFSLGHVVPRARETLAMMLEGTVAEPWVESWSTPLATTTLAPGSEQVLVALGLLAPCLVAFTIATPGWRRAVLVGGAVLLGVAVTTLSIALNFGPDHALAWVTPQVVQGLVAGAALATLLSLLPRRLAAGLGLITLTISVMLVANTPADPYYAQSLRAWEQGRFVRFHGAAQWVGWFWPYTALVYLLTRVSARPTRRGPAGA